MENDNAGIGLGLDVIQLGIRLNDLAKIVHLYLNQEVFQRACIVEDTEKIADMLSPDGWRLKLELGWQGSPPYEQMQIVLERMELAMAVRHWLHTMVLNKTLHRPPVVNEPQWENETAFFEVALVYDDDVETHSAEIHDRVLTDEEIAAKYKEVEETQ